MYTKIEDTLNKIDTIKVSDENYKNLPDIFWMEGLFGIMSSTSNSNKPNAKTNYFYSVTEKDNSNFLCLSTNDVYFTSGYDQLLSQVESFSDHFIIEAKMLIKSLVIKKIGNWESK